MSSNPIEVAPVADADLILSARGGDDAAFSQLYHRHIGAAQAAARSLVRSRTDADDLVSEAFTRVLRALRKGGGPEVAFRPYLLTAVRNAFYDRTRKDQRVEVRDEVPEDLDAVILSRAAMAGEDKELVARAFANLPERWQTVLWHTEVEGRPPAEVAPMLGIAPNAVAALAYRAREGLREAYLQAHLQIEPPAGCKDTRSKLGGYVRDSLSNRDRAKVEEHLDGCVPCRAVLAELREVSTSLRSALLPVLLGVPAATYLHHLLAGVGGKGLLVFFRRRPRGQQAAMGAGVAAAAVVAVVAVAAAVGGNDKPPTIVADTSISVTTTAAPSPATTSARPSTTAAKPTTTAAKATTTSSRAPAVLATTTTVAATTTTRAATTTTTGATTSQAPAVTTSTTVPVAPIPAPTTTTPPAPRRAALSVAGSPLGPVVANRSAFVSVSVSNAGPDPAVNARATITLPSGFTFTGSQGEGWSCSATGATVSCVRGSLAASASSSLLLQTQVGVNVTGSPTVGVSVASDAQGSPGGGTADVGLGTVQASGPAPLYAAVTRGDIVTVGNTLRTCTGCPSPVIGGGDNSGSVMVPVDVDADGSTTASSRATLSLPQGATVNRAWLVWGATSGSADSDPITANYGSVRLSGPSSTRDYFVVPSSTAGSGPKSDVYGRVEVTQLVQANGAGEYTFGSLGGFNETPAETNRSGGWALVVQYNKPTDPLRTLVVLDGMVLVNQANGPQTPTLGVIGGNVPATGVTAKVGFVAWDGDRGLPDTATLTSGSTPTPVSLSGSGNPADDVFNSTVDGLPADANTLGFDADTFSVTVYGGGPLLLEVKSPGDAIRLGVITLSVPA